MRVAVLNPYFLFGDQTRNFNGYNSQFVRQFKPVLYFPCGFFDHFAKRRAVKDDLRKAGYSPDDFLLAFTAREVNRAADVLVDFNGRPDMAPEGVYRSFRGMKFVHVMDYVFRASDAYAALFAGGVDYVLGYTDHSKHCAFFQKFYPGYSGKVIPVPFGFASRFKKLKPFVERAPKVVALGAVNPVDDPAVPNRRELLDYINFYKDVRWTHQWRRRLLENEADLSDILVSMLPHFPQTKNPNYDAVKLMNDYQMFVNDEGLMAFPPARTYEGPAAGAVMVASSHASYRDLGFIDGVNCVMHSGLDLKDFRGKVEFYIENQDKLATLSDAGHKLVTSRYSHELVAKQLFADIKEKAGR